MSVARGLGQNGGHFYSNITKPVKVDCQFVVDPTNVNGLGISSLKSNGYIQSVYMHTSATPDAANPNPVAGYALIQFNNNFNHYLGGFGQASGPLTSTTTAVTSGLTAGHIYVITSLGTTTTAEWQSIGLPAGFTPTVGQAFVATATGTGGSHTGKVGLPSSSGIQTIEFTGTPDTLIANSAIAANGGAILLVKFMSSTFTAGAYTPAGTVSQPTLTMDSYTPAGTNANDGPPETFTGTPATLTGTVSQPTFTGTAASLTGTVVTAPAAPTAGSLVNLSFFFDGSSVTIDGL